MKEITGEVITNKSPENGGNKIESARATVSRIEQQAHTKEQEAQDLQIELLKAEAAAQRREEAEVKSNATKEKIERVAE